MVSEKKTSPLLLDQVVGKKSLYEILRHRILHWYYPPGYHLAEQSLCLEFEISRIPVREALSVLASEGFVDKIRNQGCFVKQLNVKETQDWFELRLALEIYVVESLARDPSLLNKDWYTSQNAYWKRLLRTPLEADFDVSCFVNADNDFHLGLTRSIGNNRIYCMLEEVIERLRFTKLAVEITAERLRDTAKEHLGILSAIEQHDVVAVRAALKRNIEHSANRVELAIGRALMIAHNSKLQENQMSSTG
jgi:DNA-binding GntR family transcriptional regulator